MIRRTSRALPRLSALAVASGLGLALSTALVPFAQAAPDPGITVPGGVSATSIPGAQAFGDTDPNTPEQVSFVLKIKGMPNLEQAVEAGQPLNLSVAQFAQQYGQDPAAIRKLTSYLAQFGITTTVYANNLNVSAQGTADQFNRALQITQGNYKVPTTHGGSQVVHAPKSNPVLPKSVGNIVTAVLGLSNYAPYSTHAVQATSDATSDAATTGSTCPLTGARASSCHLPSDFATRYGVDPMYAQGATGAGQTIGIVTLAALDEGAPEYFWNNYMHLPATGRSVSVQNIDGGPGAPSDNAGTGETDLDVEQAGGIAPGANVIVYQAPNTDAGWSDAFFTAATQNIAGSVSSSWGASETIIRAGVASGVETPAVQTAFDEIFLELAAQGQSAFVSSADQGAYDASSDLGTTDLSVDYPGNSPYVTSSGGTTLPWSGAFHSKDGTIVAPVSVTQERAWGSDYLWPAMAKARQESEETAAKNYIAGSGGGFSTVEQRPAYQQGVSGVGPFSAVQYLTPTNYQNVMNVNLPTDWAFNPTPPITTGNGKGRVEPDVSANADPFSGYLLYEPAAGAGDELQSGWGGTSFVAPQFNGSTAVMNQLLGHRVGFWNPALYRLAQGGQSPVTPLDTPGTSNDNLYYSGTPGTLYNPATGLGTPNLALFAKERG